MNPAPLRPAPGERRYVALADGPDGLLDAKTAIGVLRYRPESVVAVVDRRHAGRRVGEVTDVAVATPIVGSLEEALAFAPNSVLVGITSPGGRFPAGFGPVLGRAVEAGLHLVNGLHDFLTDDPELVAAAARRGVDLWDLRRPPVGLPVGRGAALRVRPLIVHTIGSDCSVGKMTAALELVAALEGAGVRAEFIPTGQTGMAIAGWGIAVDAVVADFISGATERMVLEAAGRGAEVLVVEGQGTLLHPAFSGVTLGLLHGCMPHAAVMCHAAGLRELKRDFGVAIPPLGEVFALYRAAMAPFRELAWTGSALICRGLTAEAMAAACDEVERETGVPCVDPVRMGAGRLAAALLPRVAQLRSARREG